MSDQTPTSVPACGFWVRATTHVPGGPRHYLGGETRAPGAVCPNYRKPLLTLLDLDAHDPTLELQGTGLARFPVLFCWTCPAALSTVVYRFTGAGGDVALLDYKRGEPAADFPYVDYPASFPRHAVGLVALTPQEQALLHDLNSADDSDLAWTHRDLARPRHQVGGEPYLVQPLEEVRCPECQRGMPLFAALSDDALGSLKFADNDFVQALVHLCRPCRVVAVYQRCD